MNGEPIQRKDIEHAIQHLINEALNDFSQTGDTIYPQVDKLMQTIDQYSNQNDVLTPSHDMTVAEQAIFTLYRNYFMYNLMSKWTVKYHHATAPYDMRVEIYTPDFYGTGRKLNLEIFTFRNDPTKVWLCNMGQLEFQARQHHMTHQYFVEIVNRFEVDYYYPQVQYAGHANGLETALFKILNLARYLDEQPHQLPTYQQAHANRIAKVFIKHANGRVETRVD